MILNERYKKGYKLRKDEEEDVSSYGISLRKRGDTVNGRGSSMDWPHLA